MDSSREIRNKPHAVCIPFPAQGHINPFLKLARLLHSRGFYITFIHTEHNAKRLLKSKGPHALDGFPNFQFRTIPDGLPPTDADATQHPPSLCDSTSKHCLAPLLQLIRELNAANNIPPVTCIITDSIMSFGLQAAKEIGIPGVTFRTASGCSLVCYKHLRHLVDKGLVPLKDKSYVTNGYLDTVIDWLPGMIDVRLRDFPMFIRTTDPNDTMLNFAMGETDRLSKASALIMNTFDALEHNVLQALEPMCPPIYPIGPLPLLVSNQFPELDNSSKSIGSSLWKEEPECLQWLNSKDANSVIYVNFGSIIVLTSQQLVELAWGIANSKKNFLWIIRPDLVVGESAILPPEFREETKERGMIAKWCPQEQVLNHPSVGGFLTHCGWNSVLESLCAGVPMLCWPFFAEQHINCRYACSEWGVGMEINENVKRDEVENLVRELMDGEKGKEMRRQTVAWKEKAEEAISQDGSSHLNLDKVVNEVLLSKP